MHRLGFQYPDIDELIEVLKSQHAVTVRSVFSHFATADCPGQEEFVYEQKRRFDLCADKIRAAFSHKILRHICNSAGIEKFPQFQMEMCRLGIGLYGFEASEVKMDLEPVATLRSTILQIKEIPATETVGYSRKGVLSRTSRIAMIPIGYADGYNRRLGNGHASMMVRQALPYGGQCLHGCHLCRCHRLSGGSGGRQRGDLRQERACHRTLRHLGHHLLRGALDGQHARETNIL